MERNTKNKPSILFIGTYPPKKCGIATFTQDLTDFLIPELKGGYDVKICAIDKLSNAPLYPSSVQFIFDTDDLGSCADTAKRINEDASIKLVCIEHEFGLFGGRMGDYLLAFLSDLDKPFTVRFHTVLPKPDSKRLMLVQAIGYMASKVIVMTHHSARVLKEDYKINAEKIAIIPHGTHLIKSESRYYLKKKYGLEGKCVLSTFGLLSPNKGIETGILAMKQISKKYPQAVYLILGRTHPNLVEQQGEVYRESLQALIEENGLHNAVKFVNEFLSTQDLLEYLSLTDIYLFTSKDENQAVSGTFLYAMSAGCPIVSNYFVLAEEMLDEETGIILQKNTSEELAKACIYLLKNEDLRKRMRINAILATRDHLWENVAAKHHLLFDALIKKRNSVSLNPLVPLNYFPK